MGLVFSSQQVDIVQYQSIPLLRTNISHLCQRKILFPVLRRVLGRKKLEQNYLSISWLDIWKLLVSWLVPWTPFITKVCTGKNCLIPCAAYFVTLIMEDTRQKLQPVPVDILFVQILNHEENDFVSFLSGTKNGPKTGTFKLRIKRTIIVFVVIFG